MNHDQISPGCLFTTPENLRPLRRCRRICKICPCVSFPGSAPSIFHLQIPCTLAAWNKLLTFPWTYLLSYTPPGLPSHELYSDVFLPSLHLGRSQAIIKSHKKGLFPTSFSWKIQTYIHSIHTYVHIHVHIYIYVYIWILWPIYVLLMLRPFVFFKYYLANDVCIDQCMK